VCVPDKKPDHRLRWALLLGAASLAALAAVSALYATFRFRAAADYPGSMLVADNTIYDFTPHLSLRRDTSYRTNDEFPLVYNWYSNGFNLGPEAYAQSNCILMANATTSLRVVEQQMSVMVCDTSNGRLIFVMRSIGLRLRR
jgi:hypothetical protein